MLHFNENKVTTNIFIPITLIFIRDAPDTVFTGYPANPKAAYRISGHGRIPDIRPDICLDKYIFGKIQNKFFLKL
jgi:hypothetical protein